MGSLEQVTQERRQKLHVVCDLALEVTPSLPRSPIGYGTGSALFRVGVATQAQGHQEMTITGHLEGGCLMVETPPKMGGLWTPVLPSSPALPGLLLVCPLPGPSPFGSLHLACCCVAGIHLCFLSSFLYSGDLAWVPGPDGALLLVSRLRGVSGEGLCWGIEEVLSFPAWAGSIQMAHLPQARLLFLTDAHSKSPVLFTLWRKDWGPVTCAGHTLILCHLLGAGEQLWALSGGGRWLGQMELVPTWVFRSLEGLHLCPRAGPGPRLLCVWPAGPPQTPLSEGPSGPQFCSEKPTEVEAGGLRPPRPGPLRAGAAG